ncbi:MAG: epoxyqueuosine reductase [Nitrospirae bacterium]|nr:epoxyqueuosine reductase [Nitrospirota bacterium]
MSRSRKTIDAEWIRTCVEDFVSRSPENTLGFSRHEKVFDRPLVGFAAGTDSLWQVYRDHIGAFYLTPADIFLASFPGSMVSPEELTVVSWILPSTTRTRQEQAGQTRFPSERWARTRHYGELFNNALRRRLVAELANAEVQAVAPLLSPSWQRSDEGNYAPCSNWSERHAAYAAGLGTFGLCDGLITPVGKAHRTGSVIACVKVPPSERPYQDHHAYCLHFTHGTCGKCIARCPVKALSREGHDKKRCREYTEHRMNEYMRKAFGIDNYACGLCQCGVPCTDHVPGPEEG